MILMILIDLNNNLKSKILSGVCPGSDPGCLGKNREGERIGGNRLGGNRLGGNFRREPS